jgi:superfamily II DNA or RNA helicase/very-short-patch-repair endonuclease
MEPTSSHRFSDISRASPPDQKVALFRALFRGREDVFARRFESARTGRSGYQPVCANEWRRGLCDKQAVPCARCPNRQFVPVSDLMVQHHLTGADDQGRPFVMGVYPLLADETCCFLAIDFDQASWQDDVTAVLRAGRDRNVPFILERSRSGNGGHLWLFFSEPVPARLARELGSSLLTAAAERHAHPGLDSYDRLFPNQDTMPQGGFGNLIALPLQKHARAQGNTLFLDDAFAPHADPWAFLAQTRRLSAQEAESVVAPARGRDGVLGVRHPASDEDDRPAPLASVRPPPPLSGNQPTSVTVRLSDRLYVERNTLPAALLNRITRLAAFQNPSFYSAQAMRMNTFGIPRIISCAEIVADHVVLPRGCRDDLEALLQSAGIGLVLHDERCSGERLDVAFAGTLRPEQRAAAQAMLAHDTGVLAATTAFGKTVLAAWMIAQRGVNTLVLVNRRQLQEQWVARLSAFLGLPEKMIGRWGGGRKALTGRIDVALFQSLVRADGANDCVARYAHIVVDECHAVSAAGFESVIRRARARYVLGLSATPFRKDGHHPIIFMQCGPIRHRVSAKQQAARRPFVHLVKVRPTAFQPSLEASEEVAPRRRFHLYMNELCLNAARNAKLCDEIAEALGAGRSPVVLSERVDHLAVLETGLKHRIPESTAVFVFTGGAGRKQRAQLNARLEAVPREQPRLILATGRYLGEGFDDARLDTLFLAMPVSWKGVIAQYAGRLHRLDAGKREVHIHDYADLNVGMLARMFDRRCRGYEAIGYHILLPAGAVAGWPPEVELPVDPQWNETYAATVRRLIRDGVDIPLADLFVFAAKTLTDEMAGVSRARSAGEAFLFRRLETLKETEGLFTLNRKLPIPFGDSETMEVDLLCDRFKVAVEVDGAQHLGDPSAYRRDRMKDLLLQEQGYCVLRFLADDVVQRLDRVLDTVLRVIARRKNASATLPM